MEQSNFAPQIITPPQSTFKNKRGLIVTCILICVALGGIAWGVYGLISNNNKQDEINSLKTQISKLQNTASSETIEQSQENTQSPSPTIENTTPTVTQDYIYIGQWGIKIKIPDTLDVSYAYNQNSATFGIWGNPKTSGNQNYTDPQMNNYPMFYIQRGEIGKWDNCKTECGFKVFSDDKYEYRIISRQAAYYSATINADENTLQLEKDALAATNNWLTDSAAYSQI